MRQGYFWLINYNGSDSNFLFIFFLWLKWEFLASESEREATMWHPWHPFNNGRSKLHLDGRMSPPKPAPAATYRWNFLAPSRHCRYWAPATPSCQSCNRVTATGASHHVSFISGEQHGRTCPSHQPVLPTPHVVSLAHVPVANWNFTTAAWARRPTTPFRFECRSRRMPPSPSWAPSPMSREPATLEFHYRPVLSIGDHQSYYP
jgi:hypothetical protein